MNKVEISVVIPVYGCPEALQPLYSRLTRILKQITKYYEIILVNDSCPKGSWDFIGKICKKDKKVVGVNLSRNFGQLHSTNAGLQLSRGNYVILMDCDLQDKPESIIELYDEIKKGYDVVLSRRKNRIDSKTTLFFSKMFYKIYNLLSDGSYYDGDIGNYSIASRKVVDEYNKIKDQNKSYVPTLVWMGFNTSVIELESEERFVGESSYTFRKKVDMAIDMLTSNSTKPLKAIMKIGIIIAIASFVFLLLQIIRYFVLKDLNEGWTSIIASIFFMSGIILICLGGVGIYLGNVFNQTKGVPEFIIQDIINKEEKQRAKQKKK